MVRPLHTVPPVAAALLLAACGDPRIQGQQSPALAPAPACDARDRENAAGSPVKVCVLIGHDSVVRFRPPPTAPDAAALATVCNTSETERVYIAWTENRTAVAGSIWKATLADSRRTLAAGACETVGPLKAVLLRGWHDGGQGFDIATSWDATVAFSPTP